MGVLCLKVALETIYWCKTSISMIAKTHLTRQEIMSLQLITSIQWTNQDDGFGGVQLRTLLLCAQITWLPPLGCLQRWGGWRYVRTRKDYPLQDAQKGLSRKRCHHEEAEEMTSPWSFEKLPQRQSDISHPTDAFTLWSFVGWTNLDGWRTLRRIRRAPLWFICIKAASRDSSDWFSLTHTHTNNRLVTSWSVSDHGFLRYKVTSPAAADLWSLGPDLWGRV